MHPLSFFSGKLNEAFLNSNWLGDPVELYEPIKYTLDQGGKRIRPLLVLLANDLFGGKVDYALNPAIGIEIFHNFTLLHDDIMDNAPLRRGKETVYKKWNQNIAILSGDTMFAIAYSYISRIRPEHLPAVLETFNNTARQVCEGQQYDMNFEKVDVVSIGEYLEMIRLKTAVLLACSLKIGAILANAPPSEAEKLYSFGENIGLAFQLQDDLLDTFGDERSFGKEIGGDIIAGKKTFLVIKSLEILNTKGKGELMSILSDINLLSDEKVESVKAIFEKTRVYDLTINEIEKFYEKAMSLLDEILLPQENKTEIRLLANSLLNRKS